ncbi:RND1 protein, partial [Cnemophilus loriae]|nr:RND1 protein [Cnemophilus loriae]
QWKTEILDYCPNTRVLLIGCKTDLRTDLSTLLELSHQKQAPISYEQGYLECSAFTSEKSVHSIFRTVSGICLSKAPPQPPRSPPRSLSKRLLHLPSRSELISSTFKKEKAKSCSVM